MINNMMASEVNSRTFPATSDAQLKNGEKTRTHCESVKPNVETLKSAPTDKCNNKKLSRGDYAVAVVLNTVRYAANLFVFPSVQTARVIHKIFIYGGCSVGLVSGMVVGASVGVAAALREVVKGNSRGEAFKKLTEYTVKGCCLGVDTGRVVGNLIGAPAFALTFCTVAFIEIALLVGKPWLAGALIGTSFAIAGLAACEVAHTGSYKIHNKMRALENMNFYLLDKPEPEDKKAVSKTLI